MNAKELTDQLINRAKNIQYFTVSRDIPNFPTVGGTIPFDIKHRLGEPVYFKVPALTQDEAEQVVDHWLRRDDVDGEY